MRDQVIMSMLRNRHPDLHEQILSSIEAPAPREPVHYEGSP